MLEWPAGSLLSGMPTATPQQRQQLQGNAGVERISDTTASPAPSCQEHGNQVITTLLEECTLVLVTSATILLLIMRISVLV